MSKGEVDPFDGGFYTYCQDELVCPYCGEILTDSWELADEDDEMECPECNETFIYERVTEISYTSRRRKEESHESPNLEV